MIGAVVDAGAEAASAAPHISSAGHVDAAGASEAVAEVLELASCAAGPGVGFGGEDVLCPVCCAY